MEDLLAAMLAAHRHVTTGGGSSGLNSGHEQVSVACRPDQREMDTALVRDGRVFVDSRAGALAEAGDLVIPIAERAFDASHIAAELGDVFGGRADGRRSGADITIFKSLGMAVEDVAAARLAYERASERGLGRGFVL